MNLLAKLLKLLERIALISVFLVAGYVELLYLNRHIETICFLNTCVIKVNMAPPTEAVWMKQLLTIIGAQ